jgi:hypothetical protein
MNFAYGMGAAIIVVDSFKITHFELGPQGQLCFL